MLSVRDLAVAYAQVSALHGVSLDVAQGSIVALLGANGAGKSSLLSAIAGLIRPRAGSITLDGQPIHGLPPHRIVRRGVSLVPEHRDLFLDLTVAENLAMGAYVRSDREAIREDLERVYRYFPRLKDRSWQQAQTLSGGEQQMLAIGRALMNRPRLLLLDEPSLGLAPLMVTAIFDIIGRINRDAGMTILLVEQNTRLALELASYAYVLETGRIVLDGPAEALLGNDLVKQSYLGAG
jgi:branched-chain amino acid transport system ATP-binding protein